MSSDSVPARGQGVDVRIGRVVLPAAALPGPTPGRGPRRPDAARRGPTFEAAFGATLGATLGAAVEAAVEGAVTAALASGPATAGRRPDRAGSLRPLGGDDVRHTGLAEAIGAAVGRAVEARR